MKTKIYESAEDYLEGILMLQNKMGYVKSIDVAVELNVTKQSVSRAIKNLKEKAYLTIGEKGHLVLTEKGKSLAQEIYDRHVTLTKCFVLLGVDEETAVKDACKVEHDLSPITFSAMKKHFLLKESKLNSPEESTKNE
jgi:DtxR family Mn-dependent transcriptional regulator